jgi:hypothetical protein
MATDRSQMTTDIEPLLRRIGALRTEVGRVIVGQERVVE